MATPAEKIRTAALHHRIALSRYSTGLVRRIIAQLNRSEEAISERIARADNETRTKERLEQLLADIRGMQADAWAVVKRDLTENLDKLTSAEVEFTHELVVKGAGFMGVEVTSPAPSTAQVVAAVKARPFQGRFLKDWLAEAEDGAKRRVREAIRQGFVEGKTTPEMVRAIRGTKANQYKDGVLEIGRRGAETMVRTAVTHTASVAANETYKALADYIAGIEWVATLDSRTTLICAGLDGKVFPVDSGPRPPAHLGCRSTTIARLKGMPPTKRTTYAEWLKGQSPEAQDEILGPKRAALFRTGGLKLDRFTDTTNQTLNLDQLKGKNEKAFEAAGLNNPIKPPRGTPQDAIALFLADRDPVHLDFLRTAVANPKRVERWFSEPGPKDIRPGPRTATTLYTSEERRPDGSMAVYRWVNQALRDGTADLEARKLTALISDAVSRLPTSDGKTFYRGIGAASDARWAQYSEIGSVHENKQLMSVSTDRAVSTSSAFARAGMIGDQKLKGMIFKINNSRLGHNVQSLSALKTSEAEWIILPGARHRTTAAYIKDGYAWIELEDVDD